MESLARTIVVFGASGLVGNAVCLHLLKKNYKIIAVHREGNLPKCKLDNVDYIGMKELSIDGLYDLYSEMTNEQQSKVTGLINCARFPKTDLDDGDFKKRYQIFHSAILGEIGFNFAITNSSLDIFKNLQSIVLTSSIYGNVVPNPQLNNGTISSYPSEYGISKAAIQYLVRDSAIRLKRHSINVNAIALGGVKGRASENFEKKYQSLNGVSSMLDTEEFVGVYEFLVSTNSTAVTGQTILVDNGFTLC